MARSGVEWGSSSSRRRRWFRQSSPRKPTPSHLTSFAKNVKLAEWTEDPDSIASHKIIDCCFLPADLTLVKIENALRGSSRRSLDELSKQILWDPFVFENNSLRCLPFVFFVFFSSLSIRFDWQNCFFFRFLWIRLSIFAIGTNDVVLNRFLRTFESLWLCFTCRNSLAHCLDVSADSLKHVVIA